MNGKTLRIDWTGQIDPSFPFPAAGFTVNALVTVEVL